VTLFAQEFGPITASAGTVTEPVTVVIGVTDVTNPAPADPGTDEETDEEFRIRRNRSLETASSSSVGRLFSQLADLPDVTDLAIYENSTDVTDSRGIPAHNLWVVIEGGAVAEIVETMTKNKTGGKGLVGSVTGTYTETLLRPDGSEFVFIHEMTFDRPTLVPVNVRLNATRKQSGTPVDTALIAQEIAKRTYNIGDNVVAAELYEDAFRAGTTFIPTDLEVSDDGGSTWTDERLVSALDGRYTIDESDVDVTEVIP
jgi:uncharacterized phage protein gp47/JayE